MKIVTKAEFLKMPEGTVFCYYEPRIFREFNIKGDNCNDSDFFYTEIMPFVEMDSLSNHDINIECDVQVQCREGLFDDTQLYAVYSKKDVEKIIAKLKESSL